MGNMKGISLAAVSVVILTGCSDGDEFSTTSSIALDHFDTTKDIPAETTALNQSANFSFLRAIQNQVFETDFDNEYSAPHLAAWARINLNTLLQDAPFRKSYSCQEYADYLNAGNASSGQGTYTVISLLEQDFTGSVEIVYNDCVVNGYARSGSRKLIVLDSTEEYKKYDSNYGITDPSPNFRWDYSNYYWGNGGFTSYLHGSVSHTQNPDENFNESYNTVSNFKLVQKGVGNIETLNTTTRCTEDPYSNFDGEYSWQCDIQSGKIKLSGLGTYNVRSLSPYHRTLWAWGAKTEFDDEQGNRFIYWGDGQQKHLTWVTPTDTESTHVVEYDSLNFDLAEQKHISGNSELAVNVLGSVFEQWDKKLHAYQSDEFILFKNPGASTVDAIKSTDFGRRSIDLIDPAFDIHINEIGDRLTSGHDGAVRGVFLNDPNLSSEKHEIGLGKIVEILDERVVGYTPLNLSPDHIERVSYRWNEQSNSLLDTRGLTYSQNAIAHRGNAYAQISIESVYFKSLEEENYDSSQVRTGLNYDYLKFFKSDLLLTGSGVLIKCPTTCPASAIYWRSLNESIQTKYPSMGKQIFVASATDTEYSSGAANLLVFSTLPADDHPNRYTEEAPGYGSKLWAIDLNDTRRITEIKLPGNSFSKPSVGFNIHHLSKSNNGDLFVGSGSWNLDSTRDNTVFFSIDPSKIDFD